MPPCDPASGPMDGDGAPRFLITELSWLSSPATAEEEKALEAVLGTRPWNWRNAEFTACNKNILKRLMYEDAKLRRYNDNCCKKTEEVNATLDFKDKLHHIDVWPRFPTPSCFHYWYKAYRMSDSRPTPLRNVPFMEPRAHIYVSRPHLQFFSLCFAGSFLCSESMSVYGFLAIRDDIDQLRNYVFCRSRENAHVIRPGSTDLPLISPLRGISSWGTVLVEYSIKVKNEDGENSCDDYDIIDGCFEYIPWSYFHNQKDKLRIYGPLGPLDIQLMHIGDAIEANIDVKVKWAAQGYNLKSVTAFTSGHPSGIMLYDGTASVASNKPPSAWMVVASSMVAVELGGELKLAIDVCVEDDLARECVRADHNRQVKQVVQTHELSFTAQKYKSSKGAILMGCKFKLVAKITWSTVHS